MAQLQQHRHLGFVATLLLITLSIFSRFAVKVEAVGVNWGRNASHPLPPPKVVQLLKSNNVTRVRLFEADPSVLQALQGSKIEVILGIPNSMLPRLNSSFKVAQSWVHDNLTRFLSDSSPKVRIQYVLFFFYHLFLGFSFCCAEFDVKIGFSNEGFVISWLIYVICAL